MTRPTTAEGWMQPIAFDLAAAMRRARVTIRELATRTDLTMKRIRQLREAKVRVITASDAFGFLDAMAEIDRARYPETEDRPMNATLLPVTHKIAGHEIALTPGRRYLASRPIARQDVQRFDVTIQDITEGCGRDVLPTVVVPGLDYEDANAFLRAFNCGETSFEGRVW